MYRVRGKLLLRKPGWKLFQTRLFSRNDCKNGFATETCVFSFGDCSLGALGSPSVGGDIFEPTPIKELPPNISSIAAGHYHSLAVTSNGDVWAWGRNEEYQLGRGISTSRHFWHLPQKIEGLDHVSVKSVYASGVVSMALGDDGDLWVWGRSKRGQLGLGDGVIDAPKPARVKALAGEHIVKVSLGWGHVLALSSGGKLYGWGYSGEGVLGKIGKSLEKSPKSPSLTTTENSCSVMEVAKNAVLDQMEKQKDMPIIWAPKQIHETSELVIKDVACGLDHSLVLCSDGSLLSCGSNTYGQLGRNTEEGIMLPIDTTFKFLSLSSGLGHSLGVCLIPSQHNNDSGLASWGWNENFQLGRRGVETIPGLVEELSSESIVLASGGRVHSVAVCSKGNMWTWGCGKNGRLGLGSSMDSPQPTQVNSLGEYKVLQAVAGLDHNLVLCCLK